MLRRATLIPHYAMNTASPEIGSPRRASAPGGHPLVHPPPCWLPSAIPNPARSPRMDLASPRVPTATPPAGAIVDGVERLRDEAIVLLGDLVREPSLL